MEISGEAKIRTTLCRLLLRNQHGALLLESLIAIGLLATVLAASIAGLSTGSTGVGTVHELTTAQNIARSQLEHTLNEPFCAAPCTYPSISTPTGYTVTSEAVDYDPPDPNLEQIIVSVFHESKLVLTIKGVRSNR
ncbi:MAG: hypothetical protein ACE5KI_07455 [Dehalococcoidia bacterium]